MVLLTDRAASVPGLAEELHSALGCNVRPLPRAAAAQGALQSANHLVSASDGILFATRLPSAGATMTSNVRGATAAGSDPMSVAPTEAATHLVYRDRVVAIDDGPLIIGTSPPPDRRRLQIEGRTAGISRSHCTVVSADGVVVIDDHSSYGTLVNGEPVEGRAPLRAGDRILLGTPGESILAVRLED
jgi:hypothetical protein